MGGFNKKPPTTIYRLRMYTTQGLGVFFFIQVLFSIFATQILESKVTVTSVGGPKGGDVSITGWLEWVPGIWLAAWSWFKGTYCWWKKSCTTNDDDYPIIYRVLTIPVGAGFCPSTVLKNKQHLLKRPHQHLLYLRLRTKFFHWNRNFNTCNAIWELVGRSKCRTSKFPTNIQEVHVRKMRLVTS